MTLVCQKDSVFTYVKFKKLVEIVDIWDGLLPDGHFLKSKNLAIYETAVLAEPIYILVKAKNEKAVGLIYLQKNQINVGKVGGRFLNLFKPSCKNNTNLELIIVGNTYSTDAVGVFAIDLSIEKQIYSELLLVLNNLEIRYDGIIIKDLNAEIVSPKFKIFRGDFGMELKLDSVWNTIDDYAASLEKKYFKRFKKIRSALAGIDTKKISPDDFQKYSSQVWELFSAVLKKQNTQVGVVKENYFQTFLQKENTRFVAYIKADKVVAFALYHEKSESTLDVHLVGLDYLENENHSLYLNILFDSVEAAIKLKKTSLSLGRTALTAKSSLGAIPHFKIQYYYFKNKILHWSFKYILKNLYEKQVLEVRSPFKEKKLS